jgi:hypothetical protein
MDEKEIRGKAKALGIDHYWNKNIDKLKAEVEAKDISDGTEPVLDEKPEVVAEEPKAEELTPEPVEMAVPTPGPTMPPRDVENPDEAGLAQRQAEVSQEARMRALEERLILAESRADLAEERSKVLESTVAKKPTREVPERPNPNTMVYFKDGEDKKGNPIIKHKQVSFAEAKILLEKDEYGKSPAYFK